MNKTGKKICSLEECGKSFLSMTALIGHLTNDHHLEVTTKELLFSSKNHLLLWKSQVEDANAYFSAQRSIKDSLGRTVEYFECNRSEFSNRKNKGKVEGVTRQLKAAGSCRMERHCCNRRGFRPALVSFLRNQTMILACMGCW